MNASSDGCGARDRERILEARLEARHIVGLKSFDPGTVEQGVGEAQMD